MIQLLTVVSFAAGLAAFVTAAILLRHRHESPLAWPLALILIGAGEWSVARALSFTIADLGPALAFDYAIYPGVALTVAAAFWYYLVLAGHGDVLGRRAALLLAIQPTLLMIVVATDRWHHLFYTDAGLVSQGAAHPGGLTLAVEFGPLFWVHSLYNYALLFCGAAITIRAAFRAVAGHRTIYVIALIGGAAPIVGNAATLAWQKFDLTPASLLCTAAIWLWTLKYSSQTTMVPISVRQVLASLTDAVMVLAPDGRVLDVNPATLRMLGRETDGGRPPSRDDLLGAHWTSVVAREFVDEDDGSDEYTLTTADGNAYEVRVSRITYAAGRSLGTVLVIRDVTELERLRVELAELAVRDELTGLHNRRYLENCLPGAVDEARSSGRPLSAVMVDIDHFKAVNDRYGHAVGDAVLVAVARELASAVRLGDEIVRYGGEEFVVLLRGADGTSATRRAEDWRKRCSSLRIRHPEIEAGITISAGVAQVDGERADRLIERADRAMYAAKAAGRNRVVLAGELVQGRPNAQDDIASRTGQEIAQVPRPAVPHGLS